MFCPQCNAEYRDGFSRCSDCAVDLVSMVPVDPAAAIDHRRRTKPTTKEASLRFAVGVLAIGTSALAYYISTGVGTFWPAAWLAPIPILVFAFRSSKTAATVAALVACVAGRFHLPYADWGMTPLMLVVALLIYLAIPLSAAVLAARFAVRRLPPLAALFVFPAFWTAYEFLSARLPAIGTGLNLANSQVSVLPVIQIASITGIWGITFVITLIPSAAAVAWYRRAPSALALAGGVAILVIGYGYIRLRLQPQEPEIRVGLAESDFDQRAFPGTGTKATEAAHRYAERVGRLAVDGASMVALPEGLIPITPDESPDVLKILGDAARTARVTLIVGLTRVGTRLRRNVAAVIGPDGKVIAEYEKRHLVPGVEAGTKVGETPGLFMAPIGKWGVAICKDMDFPDWLQNYGRYGVQILAVPAWDFGGDGRLHSRMAVLRGVENGFSIFRAANGGLVTVNDAYGRILAEASSSHAPATLLVQSVPLGPGRTLYSRFGDWFAILCIAAVIALLTASAYRAV